MNVSVTVNTPGPKVAPLVGPVGIRDTHECTERHQSGHKHRNILPVWVGFVMSPDTASLAAAEFQTMLFDVLCEDGMDAVIGPGQGTVNTGGYMS